MMKDPDALIRLTPQQYAEIIAENTRYRKAIESIVEKYWVDPANEKEACFCCWINLHPNTMGKHTQLNGDPCPVHIAREALKGGE